MNDRHRHAVGEPGDSSKTAPRRRMTSLRTQFVFNALLKIETPLEIVRVHDAVNRLGCLFTGASEIRHRLGSAAAR